MKSRQPPLTSPVLSQTIHPCVVFSHMVEAADSCDDTRSGYVCLSSNAKNIHYLSLWLVVQISLQTLDIYVYLQGVGLLSLRSSVD
jgi:hypothetical protein